MGINLEEKVRSQRSRTCAEGHARERARGKYWCSSWEVRKSLTCVGELQEPCCGWIASGDDVLRWGEGRGRRGG